MKKRNLDSFYSDKKLGCFEENGTTVFRLFAPRAISVTLVVFHHHDDQDGQHHGLTKDDDGVWQCRLDGSYTRLYYAYKVNVSPRYAEQTDRLIADPYSKAVVSHNSYLHESKSIIIHDDDYNW